MWQVQIDRHHHHIITAVTNPIIWKVWFVWISILLLIEAQEKILWRRSFSEIGELLRCDNINISNHIYHFPFYTINYKIQGALGSLGSGEIFLGEIMIPVALLVVSAGLVNIWHKKWNHVLIEVVSYRGESSEINFLSKEMNF